MGEPELFIASGRHFLGVDGAGSKAPCHPDSRVGTLTTTLMVTGGGLVGIKPGWAVGLAASRRRQNPATGPDGFQPRAARTVRDCPRPEEGRIPSDAALIWSSCLDGNLETRSDTAISPGGFHHDSQIFVLTAVDANGATTSQPIQITAE